MWPFRQSRKKRYITARELSETRFPHLSGICFIDNREILVQGLPLRFRAKQLVPKKSRRPTQEKRVSERVSLRVMHIIRSETLGETFWREKSCQRSRQTSHPVSRQDSWRVSDRVICMTPSETLSETRFVYAGPPCVQRIHGMRDVGTPRLPRYDIQRCTP